VFYLEASSKCRESALGVVLFHIFISDLEEAREGTFIDLNLSDPPRQVGAIGLGDPHDIQ